MLASPQARNAPHGLAEDHAHIKPDAQSRKHASILAAVRADWTVGAPPKRGPAPGVPHAPHLASLYAEKLTHEFREMSQAPQHKVAAPSSLAALGLAGPGAAAAETRWHGAVYVPARRASGVSPALRPIHAQRRASLPTHMASLYHSVDGADELAAALAHPPHSAVPPMEPATLPPAPRRLPGRAALSKSLDGNVSSRQTSPKTRPSPPGAPHPSPPSLSPMREGRDLSGADTQSGPSSCSSDDAHSNFLRSDGSTSPLKAPPAPGTCPGALIHGLTEGNVLAESSAVAAAAPPKNAAKAMLLRGASEHNVHRVEFDTMPLTPPRRPRDARLCSLDEGCSLGGAQRPVAMTLLGQTSWEDDNDEDDGDESEGRDSLLFPAGERGRQRQRPAITVQDMEAGVAFMRTKSSSESPDSTRGVGEDFKNSTFDSFEAMVAQRKGLAQARLRSKAYATEMQERMKVERMARMERQLRMRAQLARDLADTSLLVDDTELLPLEQISNFIIHTLCHQLNTADRRDIRKLIRSADHQARLDAWRQQKCRERSIKFVAQCTIRPIQRVSISMLPNTLREGEAVEGFPTPKDRAKELWSILRSHVQVNIAAQRMRALARRPAARAGDASFKKEPYTIFRMIYFQNVGGHAGVTRLEGRPCP